MNSAEFKKNANFNHFIQFVVEVADGSRHVIQMYDPTFTGYEADINPITFSNDAIEFKFLSSQEKVLADDSGVNGAETLILANLGTDVVGIKYVYNSWDSPTYDAFDVEEIAPGIYIKKGTKLDFPILLSD